MAIGIGLPDSYILSRLAADRFEDVLGRPSDSAAISTCEEWLEDMDQEDIRLVRLGVEMWGARCSDEWIREELADDAEILRLIVWDWVRYLAQVEIPCEEDT